MTIFDPPGLHAIGGRWDLPVTITDGTGAPINLTGATITAVLQGGSFGGVVTVVPATAITPDDQMTATGHVNIAFLPAETALLLTTGRVRYEVRVSFDAANSDIVAMGYINAIKTVLPIS
jgi:hypothetical protein